MTYRAMVCAVSLCIVASSAFARSTVGELLDKGASKLSKEDYAALTPFRVVYQWPNRQGEGDLLYAADGTVAGSEFHYPSRSASPATGTWTVDDGGKWCIKKFMQSWDSRTDQCWFSWKLGDDYYGSLGEEKNTKVIKVKSFAKQ